MINQSFANLRSPRLILRRLHPDDLPAICAYRSLPEVARYQSWESFTSEDAARLIESQSTLQPNTRGTWFQLAIVLAATQTLIGDCGLHCPRDDPHQMEIGITLAPSHQHHGYATETLQTLLDYTFGTLKKHRVWATTDAQNHSAASLFRRVGFRQEAHFIEHAWFKGQWTSEFLFALLRREWEQHLARSPVEDS
jgi:RimJ/RimL family protein N-acetyltransferase